MAAEPGSGDGSDSSRQPGHDHTSGDTSGDTSGHTSGNTDYPGNTRHYFGFPVQLDFHKTEARLPWSKYFNIRWSKVVSQQLKCNSSL